MKAITIPTTRPNYLEQVIESIKKNNNLDQYILYLSVEPCYKKELPNLSWIKNKIFKHGKTQGVDYNQFFILNEAFKDDVEYTIRLEDDLVVSPDVTNLADWYSKQPLLDNQMCMLLWSGSTTLENPTKITVSDYFVPWGNIILKWQWEKHWKDNMLNKQYSKVFDNNNGGWDWICNGYTIKNNLKCYVPCLSRIKNIGVNGVYSNKDIWEKKFLKIVHNNKIFNNYECIL